MQVKLVENPEPRGMKITEILVYKFFGLQSKKEKYMLCLAGSSQNHWVNAKGTWNTHSTREAAIRTGLAEQLHVFKTAKELYEWMAEDD